MRLVSLRSAQDELDAVCNECVKKAKEAGCQLDMASLYEFFISQVRKNLHVVLCFSPVGDAFRNRCLKFPALVNCTTIDWFQPWPEEALASVAARFVTEMDLGTDSIKEVSERSGGRLRKTRNIY